MLAIIDDILDYLKMETGKLNLEPTTFDVRELVESVHDTFAIRCTAKAIDFVCEVDKAVPAELVGDAGRIRQVLVNLAGSAIELTDQGRIRLNIGVVSSSSSGVTLQFSLTDTGEGVAVESRGRRFEEFWTEMSSGAQVSEGTGLGLAISKRTVAMMGGKIGFESTVGVGTTFWFRLPFAVGAAESSSMMQAGHGPGDDVDRQLAGRVLLADANQTNQVISQALLSQLGLSVDVVGSGLDAVEAMRSRPYDLVLMDIAMPKMDGIEATQRIRELEGPPGRIPIVAMTAHAMRGDREKFLAQDVDDYLVKPVSRAGLGACLARWLEERPVEAERDPTGVTPQDTALDRATLDRLAGDVGEEILPELINTFLNELDSRIDLIEKAAEAVDLRGLAAQAHPLKSSAANFGAVALSRLASDIEATARAGDGPRAQAVARRTRAVAQATRERLSAAIETWR